MHDVSAQKALLVPASCPSAKGKLPTQLTLEDCSQLPTQLTLEDSPMSVLGSYSQQVPPPGMRQFAGILVMVGHLSFLFGVCFALLLLLKSSSYRLHINKHCVSLSQKSAGSICRQERRESIDLKKKLTSRAGRKFRCHVRDSYWPFSHISWFLLFRGESVSSASCWADERLRWCYLPPFPRGVPNTFCVFSQHIVYLLGSEVLFKDNCRKWKAILLREGEPFRRWTWEQGQLPVTCWVLFANLLLGWPSGEDRQRRERRGQGVLPRPSLASHLFPLPHSTPSGVPAKRKRCSSSSSLSWTNHVRSMPGHLGCRSQESREEGGDPCPLDGPQ